MPDLGKAWHIPALPQPHGCGGMRVPTGPVLPGTYLTIINGNQYQGAIGNPGDQFQDCSAVFIRLAGDPVYTELPMTFLRVEPALNNKYFKAGWQVPEDAAVGADVEYYLRIRYGDHDDTYLAAAAGGTSTPTGDEAAAQASPFRITLDSPATFGRWGEVFALTNVPIHSTVLPNGRVLMWGRRDKADDSLDTVESTPSVWDPGPGETGAVVGATASPTTADGKKINLFCSGHAFLGDGTLLVAGGHIKDSVGTDTVFRYSPDAAGGVGTWTAMPTRMDHGRWYPTATTLPDGSVLVASGSYQTGTNGDGSPKTDNNKWPEVWQDGAPHQLNGLPNDQSLELYPRMHVRGEDGTVFMSGPLGPSWFLSVPNGGTWTPGDARDGGRRDYGTSVEYAPGRIVYMGGGTKDGDFTPTAEVEVTDLRAATPWWRDGTSMLTARRQHNGTVLPDGTVLVTGGTSGPGDPSLGANRGFNDLRDGFPVHRADLWRPGADPGPIAEPPAGTPLDRVGSWTALAAEDEDRCYHSTAVLLPDGRILSAGGGEYRPQDGWQAPPNDAVDTHRTGQIFSPPYLFTKEQRPRITAAPAAVGYGDTFDVSVDAPDGIERVTWLGLSSVTHSMNTAQRFAQLDFTVQGGVLKVAAPDSPLGCTPGHHQLFVLDGHGVPSTAAIVRIAAPQDQVLGEAAAVPRSLRVPMVTPDAAIAVDTREPLPPDSLPVVVGVTGTCPYGIGACWGGADDALRHLTGVRGVEPAPDTATSTAVVHLEDGHLPAVDRWPVEFAASVGGSYTLRGFEVTLRGHVHGADGGLVLDSGRPRPPVRLAPLGAGDKVQWDVAGRAPATATDVERAAFGSLSDGMSVEVTGPLNRFDDGYELRVRVVVT